MLRNNGINFLPSLLALKIFKLPIMKRTTPKILPAVFLCKNQATDLTFLRLLLSLKPTPKKKKKKIRLAKQVSK